jgi:gliding motility-associated-like protein
MGTDIVNGRALEVQGGSDYIIKNNIFANTGGGYAAYFASVPASKDIDYNNYYSTGNSFGYLGGQLFSNLTSWGIALNSDANSKNLNPNYKADTALLPFQKQFNGAGISSGNILLDIDGELRNQQAPDIGAQEFMVDFGVTRLVSPTNDCFQKDSTPVTIYLRQFGDIPFIDLKLAYQVNNGPIFNDTIPGTISNDLEYTFKRPQDMSTNGEYLFKIWLVENGDDNLNNDTLVVLRKNKNAPRVDFSYVTQCAGIGVPFTGTAAIDTGFIARIEWEFGDSTIGVGYTPSHIYDTSGTYSVTMRAFSDQGCFSEVKKNIVLKPTPVASFSVKDACFGTAVKPVNTSLIKPGGTISNYVWKWGDGQTSTGFELAHQYALPDTFDINLIATGTNGCIDSVSNKVISYSLENTAFKLNKPLQDFICEGTSLKLSASGANAYQWFFNKQPINVAVDSVYQATKAGDYSIVFFNALGCKSSESAPLKIKLNPTPEAKFSFDSYCAGSPIQFRDSSKVDVLNKIKYSWNFGDGTATAQVGNPVFTYTKEGQYTVTLIIQSTVCVNQADTISTTLKVENAIKGKRYEPVSVLENKSKKLEAREFGVKYEWTPSTYLDNPKIDEPKYTAGKEQTYLIKITANSGCVTVDTLQVVLYSKCDIRAPEGFSPNDDGKNDKFYPFQIGIKNMQVFRVYDRFGNLVYDDKNANSSNGWDGKHKNKQLPIGTYVWVAEGIGEDDIPVKRSGNVILIK